MRGAGFSLQRSNNKVRVEASAFPEATGRPPSPAAARRRPTTSEAQWHALADAILDHDRAIQIEIQRAKGPAIVDGDGPAARDLDPLASIGHYSTCIAGHVREAAAALDRSPGSEPSLRASDLHSHLRTLDVLRDVLRLTAREPLVDGRARGDGRI